MAIAAVSELTPAVVGKTAPASSTPATPTEIDAGNITSGTLAAARGGAGAVDGLLKADGAGNVSEATAGQDYLSPGVSATLSKGFKVNPADLGTVSSGAITPDLANGNSQFYTNNGAHTINAPADDGGVDILVTNGASAGAITFSGFTVAAGASSALDTTSGHMFWISIRRINGVATYGVQPLQ